jgi:hypothetical protein
VKSASLAAPELEIRETQPRRIWTHPLLRQVALSKTVSGSDSVRR